MSTATDLQGKFQSMTTRVIHNSAQCSMNRRRQVINIPISASSAQTLVDMEAEGATLKFCTKC